MKLPRLLLLITLASQPVIGQITTSHYVAVDDTTKLALDVHLPTTYKEGKLPVLVVFGRYWRSSISKKTKELNSPFSMLDRCFSDHGYVIVKVDTRGSGASFGARTGEYSPIEVIDARAILDWVIKQSWSDGNIGSYGTSYEGTTAELLCATNHPAIKGVILGWSDFDIYRSPVRPYGMLASGFIKKWGLYVSLLDNNKSLILRESINPVDKDSLKLALKEHKSNPKIYKLTKNSPYRDNTVGEYSYVDCSPVSWKEEIEKSNVPMLVLTSWLDAGTAEGTLTRLEYYSNPQKVLMMATNHGGWSNASPFVVGDTIFYPKPTYAVQHKLQLDFLDHHLKGLDNKVEDWPLMRYYNLGEEEFKETNTWPIKGTSATNFYFNAEGGLAKDRPIENEASATYEVDFAVTTGDQNRWKTQMGGPVLGLHHRNNQDAQMLTYTSLPMKEDVQITGTPVVTLNMSSTHSDGAVFVYMEDVDENGMSCYITEGGLRLIHRKISTDSSSFNMHSFSEEDAALMQPGKKELVSFKLWPTSVLIQKGHSIRIAIAGADKGTFDKIPKQGKPTLTIDLSQTEGSFVSLPVLEE